MSMMKSYQFNFDKLLFDNYQLYNIFSKLTIGLKIIFTYNKYIKFHINSKLFINSSIQIKINEI